MAKTGRMSTARSRVLGGAIALVLVAGLVAAAVEPGDGDESRSGPATTWECAQAYSGINQGMAVGMAVYLLEQRLTRGGYPDAGQAFYEEAADDLRGRDLREPLGTEPFGPPCEELEPGDLDHLPSSFDDEHAAEAIVQREDGRFEEVELAEVVEQLLLRPEHGRPVYARVVGDDAMVVVDRLDGRRGAFAFNDADGDGTYVEVSSEGMRLPAYTSADGTAVAGIAFFSPEGFAYASTTEAGAVTASLASDGLHLPIFDVPDGVADLSDAWGIAHQCGRPFTITWTADDGAPVDDLTATFSCGPID